MPRPPEPRSAGPGPGPPGIAARPGTRGRRTAAAGPGRLLLLVPAVPSRAERGRGRRAGPTAAPLPQPRGRVRPSVTARPRSARPRHGGPALPATGQGAPPRVLTAGQGMARSPRPCRGAASCRGRGRCGLGAAVAASRTQQHGGRRASSLLPPRGGAGPAPLPPPALRGGEGRAGEGKGGEGRRGWHPARAVGTVGSPDQGITASPRLLDHLLV